MKKALLLTVASLFLASSSFATYIVVLKDGTQYKAKSKPASTTGKIIVELDNGQTLQLDASLVDWPKSEATTKVGSGNAKIVDLDAKLPDAQKPDQPVSLGQRVKLKNLAGNAQQNANNAPPTAPAQSPNPKPTGTAPAVAPALPPPGTPGLLPQQVIEKFDSAYDNVGIFEHPIKATGPRSLRAELTADSEDKVFNAISATSFLMVRNAGVAGAQIDMVELFMKTTNGGAAGRFQMTRSDAEMLDQKKMSLQDYYVHKVIY